MCPHLEAAPVKQILSGWQDYTSQDCLNVKNTRQTGSYSREYTERQSVFEQLSMADSVHVAALQLFYLRYGTYRAELNVPDKRGSYQYTLKHSGKR